MGMHKRLSYEQKIKNMQWLVRNLKDEFPGLWDLKTDVNGADLVQWLTNEIKELEL